MVLPTAPPASLSVSQILTEFSIAPATQKRISNDLFPLVGGTAGATCSLAASFSGKSAVSTYNSSAAFRGESTNCYGVAISPLDGSIYVCGSNYGASSPITNFATNPSGTAGTIPSPNPGVGRGFVAKWNSAGTYQGAAIVFSANSAESAGFRAVACDSTGAVYVGGFWSGFGSGAGISNFATNPGGTAGSLPAVSANGGFIAKWNSSGVYQSAAQVTVSGVSGITVDSSNNVFVSATAAGTISNFATNPSGTAGTIPGGGFIAKWNSSGVYQGSAYVNGNTNATSVKNDSSGNVYLCGYYIISSPNISNFGINPSGTAGTLPAPSQFYSIYNQAAFIAKWNSSGVYQGSAYVEGAEGSDTPNNITVDPSNNVYLTGISVYAAAISNFGVNPSGTAGSLPNPVATMAFIIKWNSSGVYQGTAIFHKASGNTNYSACDSAGNIYMTGMAFSAGASVTNFATNPLLSGTAFPTPLGTGGAVFVVKWDSSGTYKNAALVGNPAGVTSGGGITIDSSRNIYVCGAYYGGGKVCGTTDFAASPSQSSSTGNLPAAPGGDDTARGFIVKWNA